MLISEKTSEALDELTGAYFDLNRTFDRAVSIMTNTWSMPNAANIIHHNLAHLFPLMADLVTEIKDKYNLTSVYPETHRDARTYTNLEDMMTTLLKEISDVYEIIKMIDIISHENGDFMVHAELIDIMNKHSIVFGQVVTLRDKSLQMSTDYDNFDRHILSWGIDGLPELLNPNNEDDD